MLLAAGSAMGALGAHALKDVLNEARLESWDTACVYMLVMGAALVGAPASEQGQRRALNMVLVGTWLFSGSIVGLVVLGTLEVGDVVSRCVGPCDPDRGRVDDCRLVGLGLASLGVAEKVTGRKNGKR